MTVRIRRVVTALPVYAGLDGARPAVRLDGNEHPLGPAPGALAALADVRPDDLARYPTTGSVRRRWARVLGVPASHLLVTAGSGPALALIAELVLDAGERAVLLAPSFELYGLAVRRRGAEPVVVPVRRTFPFAAVRRGLNLPGVRLCLLGYPDNPTGIAPSKRQLARLVQAYPRVLFAVDEAYAEFTGRTMLDVAGARPNLLVLRTMSKAWGLAGERVGAVVGMPRLLSRLARLNVPYPVTALGVRVACAALEDVPFMRRGVAHVRRERPRLVRRLRERGLRARATSANFVLVETGSRRRAQALVAGLGLAGVAVRDRSHLPGMAGTVRISVGTVAEHTALLDVVRLLMVPAPSALLFDMDGTLVDVTQSYDEIIWRLVRTYAGARAGMRGDVLSVKNDPAANDDVDAILLALRRRGVVVERAEIVRAFNALYRGAHGLHRRDRWLVSAHDLRALARRLPLAVVTGRPRAELALAWRRQPVRDVFGALVSADDTRRRKPDAAPVRKALRALGVRSGWMIGDAPADLLAARAAGVPAIGIATGARADLLRRYQPLAVLDSAARLSAIMRGRELLADAEEDQ